MRTPDPSFPALRADARANLPSQVQRATEVYIPPHRPDLFGLFEVVLRFTRRLGWG
ncbi:hypothetical protein PQU92_16125 [Asticcacaulis sp. BYS171W]|uniref:Uncharacterized protein n=1 Tax=Asticcacaulis aquaticus TaxID=2984212 RepID=A0ABT5HXL4_9CAUL|nr:hypothetical protein [Asticcacaulis aquaticus]MDC7684812.1 hypothetical protein [Asticcacaulis aquaticus]